MKDRTIHSVQHNITMKSWMKKVDATGYAIFPGRIYIDSFVKYVHNRDRYENKMLQLLNNGYTSFVDVLHWDYNLSLQELTFTHAAYHTNSPLDYVFYVSLPINLLNVHIIREASRLNIRQIQIKISHINDFAPHHWESLFMISKKYGISLTITPHTAFINRNLGKKTVADITHYWYYLNKKYGRKALSLFSTQTSKQKDADSRTICEQLLHTYSYNPAKQAGIYPQKGAIAVGSDADLVLVPIDLLEQQKQLTPHFIFLRGVLYLLPMTSLPSINGVQLNRRVITT